MRLLFLATLVALFVIPATAGASRHRHGHCNHHCLVRSQHHFQKRVIAPYRGWLGSTGACESGTDSNLHHGLHAVGGGGAFRGRYQFGWHTWSAIGGHGDPVNASWLEQAYRAVKWRQRIGNPHQAAGWPVCG